MRVGQTMMSVVPHSRMNGNNKEGLARGTNIQNQNCFYSCRLERAAHEGTEMGVGEDLVSNIGAGLLGRGVSPKVSHPSIPS